MTEGFLWRIRRDGDAYEKVRAANLEVSGGSLVFHDANGLVEFAYAPGQWTEVWLDRDDD